MFVYNMVSRGRSKLCLCTIWYLEVGVSCVCVQYNLCHFLFKQNGTRRTISDNNSTSSHYVLLATDNFILTVVMMAVCAIFLNVPAFLFLVPALVYSKKVAKEFYKLFLCVYNPPPPPPPHPPHFKF